MQIEVRILTARASNGSASRPQDELIGFPNAANDLPQQFPHTLREVNTLTGLQLRDLLTFYGEEVPNGVEDRRDAFQRFIGMRLLDIFFAIGTARVLCDKSHLEDIDFICRVIGGRL